MEVSDVLDLLSQTKGQTIDVKNILSASISNNILSLVSNRRLPMGHHGRHIIDHGVESFQTIYNPSGITAHYPWLFKILANFGMLGVGQKLKDILNMNTFIR